MHALTRLIAALLALVTVARHTAAQAPTDQALAARIDELAARALAGPGAAGLSIAVARGDTVILRKGYGFADLEHGTPATDATLFRVASITKQYTATAIMKLAEEGKLALDDDFTKYVDFPTQGRTVTIRQLLTHTSGIKSYTDITAQEEPTAGDIAPEAVLDAVRGLPFDFEPGTTWAYNNTGYHLLGLIIEEVSGVAYAQYLQDEFFTPLNLVRTRYDEAPAIIPGRARGYRILDGETANAGYINMRVPFSSGSLMASAGDLVAWQSALVAGEVVSPDSYRQMTTTATLADGSPTGYGFGLRLGDLDGHPSVMHGGGINGFNSVLAFYPEATLSVAVLSNSESVASGHLAQEIAREALGIAPDLEDLTLPTAELDLLSGNYRIEEIELDMIVTAAGGRLYVQGTGEPPVPVMAQRGGEFRASWDSSLKIIFDPPSAPGGKSPAFTLEQGGGTFKALRVP